MAKELKSACCVLLALLLTGCASDSATRSGMPPSEEDLIAGMHVVDCLLPGQLRSLGTGTYLTARRPVKTTAADCNRRGGEYVAYDRADYQTALRVWMPAAEAGDAEAQVHVGEIFEKGLGTEPNYDAAVHWYGKAAEQGNERALFNLGTLYEQGLGVEKDRLTALNYYRQAWGLPEDSLMYQATAEREREALQAELNRELEQKDAQIRALARQTEALREQLEEATREAAERDDDAMLARNRRLEAELESLTQLVSALREDRDQVEQRLDAIPALRSAEAPAPERPPAEFTRVDDLELGRYYALVVGNRNYLSLDQLETPVNDAREIASILENRYGFQVQLLIDADRLDLMRAINDLHERLGEEDNLLVYYAGHGTLIDIGRQRDTGYWLPINADPPPNDSFWVPNEFITNHLGRFKARRVLVIADSCYGGLLSTSPGHLFLDNGAAADNLDYVRYKLPRRSRLLLSSGGDKPVLDSDGGNHSVFARYLIEVLRNNDAIMTAPELFQQIREPIRERASAQGFVQEPVYKSIKSAGHEVGDFFFVPQT